VRLTRDAFGPHLRAARERAGVSLEAISQSTKIQQSLLAGLERNDLSHWPSGIFRRAFFREYLAAIGIESEALVADFVRLFPESGSPDAEDAFLPVGSAHELRLTLAESPTASATRRLRAIVGAGFDFTIVLAGGWGLSRAANIELMATLSLAALAYVVGGVWWLAMTPGNWLIAPHRAMRRRNADAVETLPRTAEPAPLRLVARQSEQPRTASVANEESSKRKARRRVR
jgi:hypothetical protein